MRYISFLRSDGRAGYGRLAGDRVDDLSTIPGVPHSLKAALAAGTLDTLAGGDAVALADVTLLPPIPDPARILCVGLNYVSHVEETGRQQAEHPTIFTRWPSSLVADGAALICPRESDRFDFEGELAVVIGKGGRRIAAADAASHIAGYAIFNDGSVRDWQRHTTQFTPGKNFFASGSFGPALVTADEIDDLGSQRVQTRLNGQLVQDQPISDMIFDIATIIAYCSTFTPLEPGDVIATGTPGGVGAARTPPLFMKAGDQVEVSIGVLGTLSNAVVGD